LKFLSIVKNNWEPKGELNAIFLSYEIVKNVKVKSFQYSILMFFIINAIKTFSQEK
jgi:hypothetical protein